MIFFLKLVSFSKLTRRPVPLTLQHHNGHNATNLLPLCVHLQGNLFFNLKSLCSMPVGWGLWIVYNRVRNLRLKKALTIHGTDHKIIVRNNI